jgi:hypothetical protein
MAGAVAPELLFADYWRDVTTWVCGWRSAARASAATPPEIVFRLALDTAVVLTAQILAKPCSPPTRPTHPNPGHARCSLQSMRSGIAPNRRLPWRRGSGDEGDCGYAEHRVAKPADQIQSGAGLPAVGGRTEGDFVWSPNLVTAAASVAWQPVG